MKRSIIAVAALLLLLSSTTYAAPPRPQLRMRFFLGPVLAWLGFGHYHGETRMARHDERGHRPPAFVFGYGYVPPGHRGRPYYGRGRHFGWQNGQHNGWDRNDPNHGGRPGTVNPPDGGHGHGREGGRG
jgi:hypothetical protein